jgi:glycopeptide antibiotics resistance protein
MAAVFLLSPSPDLPSRVVVRVASAGQALGLPAPLLDPGRVEFCLNVAALMPIVALGSALWPARNWRDWTALGFCVAFAVETAQALMPDRSATFVDVVANTLGAALGGALVGFARRHLRRRQDRL